MPLFANTSRTFNALGCGLMAFAASLSAMALPPVQDAETLVRTGQPVPSIPTAGGITAFTTLDDEHVMLSLADNQQYLLTLNRECFGLRWARHVGVTVSDNAIWAGFDALTADGAACPIREIHRVHDADRAVDAL
jgi:hypothetical protein